MNVQTSPVNTEEPSLAEMLHQITSSINIDLAICIADTMNIYLNAIRRAGRSTILPNDVIRILHMINQLQDACAMKPEQDVIPGVPTRRPIPHD